MVTTSLTKEDKRFIERVKPLLKEFLVMCKKRGIEPSAGSYILSTNDNIYHGVPFEVARLIHGEENAIGTMITEEGKCSKVKTILAVGSHKEIIMPCGKCREALYKYGIKNACANIDECIMCGACQGICFNNAILRHWAW